MEPHSCLTFRSYQNPLGIGQRAIFFAACILSLYVISFSLAEESSEDEGPLTFIEMVLRSDLVLYGKIIETYNDSRFNSTRVYNAEMEVFCIIKGSATNRILNLSYAGYQPAGSLSTQFNVRHNYIVIADFDGDIYRPIDTEITATAANLADVSKACGINPKYPFGVKKATMSVLERCPTPAPSNACIDENYFTTTTTTTTTTVVPDDEYYPDLNDSISEWYRDSAASPTSFSISSTKDHPFILTAAVLLNIVLLKADLY